MKTIKVFALPSHQQKDRTSGVDFARVIQPMAHLNGWQNDEYKIETYIYDPIRDERLDWIKVCTDFDVLFFNYTANPWAFAAMGAMARKMNRIMVMDIDDNIWSIVEDNPAYEVYKKGSDGIRNFTAIVNEVDYITCTSPYLRNAIVHNSKKTHEKIFVFDNYIDLDLYKYPQPFKDEREIVLTHFGSTTHFIDLQNDHFVNGIDMVMKNYPNVKFLTVGAFVPMFRKMWGQRYENEFGHVDIYKWISDRFPEVMANTDICVVPLDDNIYTRCKSAIKFLEMGSAKKPGVWQDIRQYAAVVDGSNGLLARTGKDWFDAIKSLIDDKEKRKTMGESAYETVKTMQIKDHVEKYAEFLIKIDKTNKKS